MVSGTHMTLVRWLPAAKLVVSNNYNDCYHCCYCCCYCYCYYMFPVRRLGVHRENLMMVVKPQKLSGTRHFVTKFEGQCES
jgi:hypothetical protein